MATQQFHPVSWLGPADISANICLSFSRSSCAERHFDPPVRINPPHIPLTTLQKPSSGDFTSVHRIICRLELNMKLQIYRRPVNIKPRRAAALCRRVFCVTISKHFQLFTHRYLYHRSMIIPSEQD